MWVAWSQVLANTCKCLASVTQQNSALLQHTYHHYAQIKFISSLSEWKAVDTPTENVNANFEGIIDGANNIADLPGVQWSQWVGGPLHPTLPTFPPCQSVSSLQHGWKKHQYGEATHYEEAVTGIVQVHRRYPTDCIGNQPVCTH